MIEGIEVAADVIESVADMVGAAAGDSKNGGCSCALFALVFVCIAGLIALIIWG